MSVVEVQGEVGVDPDRGERAGWFSDREPQKFGEEPCRGVLVGGSDDGVVQDDDHRYLLRRCVRYARILGAIRTER